MNKLYKKYPLYDPEKYHDACGVGFVATRSGKPDPKVLPSALSALQRLTHRGAKAYDGNSGDGSGILVDIPRKFYEKVKNSLESKIFMRSSYFYEFKNYLKIISNI